MVVQQTSLVAFRKGSKERIRSLVYSCVNDVVPMTAWEITKKLNYVYSLDFHRSNVHPRLNELVKQGLLVVGRKFCPVSKQVCLSYERL